MRGLAPPAAVPLRALRVGAWAWEPAWGRGRVFTWTVTHRPIDPAFADELPYAVLVVELDEGPRVVGNLLGLEPADLASTYRCVVELDGRAPRLAFLRRSGPAAEGPTGTRSGSM